MSDRKKVLIDVFGACTARDIFGFISNEKFEVGKSYQLSFLPLFDDSDIFRINPVSPDDLNMKTGHGRMTAAADINRTALTGLKESNAEWIVIDVCSIPKGLWEASFGGETHYYSGDLVDRKSIERSISAKNLEMESLKMVSYDDVPDSENYIDLFCNFLKERYGENIILLEIKEALWHLDKEGNVSLVQDSGVEERCRQMDDYFLKFMNRLDCYYIRTPANVICDSYHHFGFNHVNYVQEWYDYANKCVELITSGDKDWLRKMDRMNIELTCLFDQIRSRNALSRTNTIRRFEEKYKSLSIAEEIDDLIHEMSDVVDLSNDHLMKSEIQGRIARIYRDRKDGNADADLAVEWMRKASDNGLGWAKNELFDLLWKINTPDSTLEMINLAYECASEGDALMMGRIGRAYREGRGVPKNLDAASKWMCKSAEMGCPWAKWEYYEILWKINTPESLKTMIEYGQTESDKGNMELKARLARAYRDGKGVEKDLRKAANLMKETHAGNPQWSKWEYIDILWKINTPETDKEMFDFAISSASSGQKEIQGLIGRMYHFGRGVDKDIDVAAKWLRKASNQNLGWAKNELFDVLWSMGKPDTDREMYSIASTFAVSGDGGAMGRLSKCYRDGRGVKKDLAKAKMWMSKAVDKGVPWAKKELESMKSI